MAHKKKKQIQKQNKERKRKATEMKTENGKYKGKPMSHKLKGSSNVSSNEWNNHHQIIFPKSNCIEFDARRQPTLQSRNKLQFPFLIGLKSAILRLTLEIYLLKYIQILFGKKMKQKSQSHL